MIRISPDTSLPKFFHRKSPPGFTLLEIAMIAAIIALLAAIATPKIKTLLRVGQLTKARGWVHAVVVAIENYNADTGEYPQNLAELTSTSPPYLLPATAAKCGTMIVDGGVQILYSCNFNTIQFHYLIAYIQRDLLAAAKIPPKVVEYNELRTRIPWDSGVCGTLAPNIKYFYETLEGKVTATGCGVTG